MNRPDTLAPPLPSHRDEGGWLVFFGGGWVWGLIGVFERWIGIGEGGRSGEWGGIVQHFFPVVEFVAERKLLLYLGEGREQDLAEVGEDGGFARGDAVLGDGGKEFAEDVVDVGGGEEIAVEGDGNLVAQALGLEELQFLPGMEGTERRMDRAAQHAAAAAVGKLKLAARGDTCAGILIRHGNLFKVDLSCSQTGTDRPSRLLKKTEKADPSLRSG